MLTPVVMPVSFNADNIACSTYWVARSTDATGAEASSPSYMVKLYTWSNIGGVVHHWTLGFSEDGLRAATECQRYGVHEGCFTETFEAAPAVGIAPNTLV